MAFSTRSVTSGPVVGLLGEVFTVLLTQLMHHYVAFLRGMNLGNRRIKMDDLRALFAELNFANVATLIASGNVIFTSNTGDGRKIENRIQHHLRKSLGYDVATFVRTRTEVAAVAAFQPFATADLDDPAHTVHAGFLADALSADQVHRLLSCRTAADEFQVEGREYYWLCRIKSNESKVWTSPAMKAVRLPSSTMRNLSTVRKLAALYPTQNKAAGTRPPETQRQLSPVKNRNRIAG